MAPNIRDGAAIASLCLLPDEIINQIFFYLSPRDNLKSLQIVSRRLYRLANEPLLWRYYCCTHFRYWHPSHDFESKCSRRVDFTDWKGLFCHRSNLNKRIAQLLDEILATKLGRNKRCELIALLGYDAKDFLLSQCQVDTSQGDGLARRYFSDVILSSIHRSIAIAEWDSLRRASSAESTQLEGTQLERALGAFGMFEMDDQSSELSDVRSSRPMFQYDAHSSQISQGFDQVTSSFRSSQPQFDSLTMRQKALSLLRWLRARNLTGNREHGRDYCNLRNCLFGQVRHHEGQISIPLISTAIFCCVASRLGVDARCCAFPNYVHAIVYPTPGRTLDDLLLQPDQSSDAMQRMFLDPYGSDDEVPTYVLQDMLQQVGLARAVEFFLAPVTAVRMVLRTAKNIEASVPIINDDYPPPEWRNTAIMISMRCKYAALWASLMVTPPNNLEWTDDLNKILRQCAAYWPEDAWLIEKYLWPAYAQAFPLDDGSSPGSTHFLQYPWKHLHSIKHQDECMPPLLVRDQRHAFGPRLKIGQVVRHRRYGWTGVITSWYCSNTVGRSDNTFYFTCIPNYGQEPFSVVAANSLEPIFDMSLLTGDMFPMAGRFFKRFDPESCTFISNIREQFPDD